MFHKETLNDLRKVLYYKFIENIDRLNIRTKKIFLYHCVSLLWNNE